jgi:hypothetical protein
MREIRWRRWREGEGGRSINRAFVEKKSLNTKRIILIGKTV